MNEDFKNIRTQKIELIDAKGRIRAVFGLGENDQPSLQLLRQNGSVAVRLSTQVHPGIDLDREPYERGECSNLEFFDMEGKVRMTMEMSDETPQYPGVALMDSRGRELIGLVVTPNDDAEIHILDTNGRPVWIKESK